VPSFASSKVHIAERFSRAGLSTVDRLLNDAAPAYEQPIFASCPN
jgi:hypothetical protein